MEIMSDTVDKNTTVAFLSAPDFMELFQAWLTFCVTVVLVQALSFIGNNWSRNRHFTERHCGFVAADTVMKPDGSEVTLRLPACIHALLEFLVRSSAVVQRNRSWIITDLSKECLKNRTPENVRCGLVLIWSLLQ